MGSWQGSNICKKCTDRVFRKTLLPHCHRFLGRAQGEPRFASVDAGDIAGSAITGGSQMPARYLNLYRMSRCKTASLTPIRLSLRLKSMCVPGPSCAKSVTVCKHSSLQKKIFAISAEEVILLFLGRNVLNAFLQQRPFGNSGLEKSSRRSCHRERNERILRCRCQGRTKRSKPLRQKIRKAPGPDKAGTTAP